MINKDNLITSISQLNIKDIYRVTHKDKTNSYFDGFYMTFILVKIAPDTFRYIEIQFNRYKPNWTFDKNFLFKYWIIEKIGTEESNPEYFL